MENNSINHNVSTTSITVGSQNDGQSTVNKTDSDNVSTETNLLLETQITGSISQTNSLDQTASDHSADNESTRVLAKNENKWQIIEGLKDGQRYEEKPIKFSGFMLKRRKRPLKGWHKRYFCLDNGILSYGKSASDLLKGKIHGSIDVGLSVISTKSSSRRIDIDSEYIFHLKVKKNDCFNHWISALKNHRLARQHEINYGNQFLDNIYCDNSNSILQESRLKENLSSEQFINKFNDSDINDTLFKLQEKLIKLSSLLKFVEVQNETLNKGVTDFEGFKYKKPRKRFHLRKKKSQISSTKMNYPSENVKEDYFSLDSNNLSLSHSSLAEEHLSNSNFTKVNQANLYEGEGKSLSKRKAMIDFIEIANEANNEFRQLLITFQEEKQIRFKADSYSCNNSTSTNLKDDFANNRTNSIDDCDEATFYQNLSRHSQDDSSALSISEYYDAEDKSSPSDYNSTSSEEDDDESVITDFSEDGANYQLNKSCVFNTGRRSKLPNVQPESSDISLWSLLCKNIGKDLSKISMPVTINEPLSVLQRLCEELEYCELLDSAAATDDPCQRMLLMAAFAVSSYSSSYYRAGHKPFNPLLGETYECFREDKNFKFLAEQVSHHPPVSACHCESKNYIFWQEIRVKSKFWGKSMEIIPFGTVNVLLKPYNCLYKWNKITTCVHNLFKGERYVDNYGELAITDNVNNMTCKITFEKSSYWSNKKNEINGVICNAKGEVIEKIFGKWNEAIHCGNSGSTRCIWRPGAMPENYQLYYGFNRFAIELNELRDEDKCHLPPTDTRFRPDQRLLEEGNIAQAETAKLDLEQLQRDRRRQREVECVEEYVPLWFRKDFINGEPTYSFNGKYWESRKNKFSGIEFTKLW